MEGFPFADHMRPAFGIDHHHAGAQGDESAVVCALELAPTQLRIAGEIAVSPKKQGKSQPEVARLKDGRLEAEQWKS